MESTELVNVTDSTLRKFIEFCNQRGYIKSIEENSTNMISVLSIMDDAIIDFCGARHLGIQKIQWMNLVGDLDSWLIVQKGIKTKFERLSPYLTIRFLMEIPERFKNTIMYEQAIATATANINKQK